MYAYGYAHDETAEQGEEKKVSNIVNSNMYCYL